MTLYYYTYNNYYNRTIKVEDTLAAYGTPLGIQPKVNFNPNDGVNTTIVMGTGTAVWDIDPDYVVVVNDDGSINSRWFIIEANKGRKGQYNTVLRRDLFADYYTNIIGADVFIEKATLTYDDPFIFNSENMSFNQIKKQETLLYDDTRIPWIVGYCTKDSFTSGESFDINSGLTWRETEADEIVSSLDNIIGYFGKYYSSEGTVLYTTELERARPSWYTFTTQIGKIQNKPLGKEYGRAQLDINGYRAIGAPTKNTFNNRANAANAAINSLSSKYNDYLFEFVASESWINAQNGKKIFATSTNTMYQVVVNDLGEVTEEQQLLTQGTEPWISLDNIMLANSFEYENDNTKGQWYYQYTGKMYSLTFKELGDIVKSKITFPNTDVRQHTADAAYDMFCIPAGEKEFGVNVGGKMMYGVLPTIEGAIQLASKFAEMVVGENTKVYDIQLLPYCPFDARLQATATSEEIIWADVGILTKEENRDYNVFLNETGKPVSVLTWCSHAAGTFNVNNIIPQPTTAIETKVMNECDMWRLCSPNWNGQFEFNAAKNNGVYGFNIDYCYKPYQPYIHINPNFSGLYGQDFNDARGLICGGDFSLTQFSDAFVNYKMSNKNFQETFDRQIQNMETTQSIERKQQKWQIVAGTIGGAAQGAVSGAVSGGGAAGAIAGATIGGIASAIGGALDLKYSDMLRNEALDYTKDQFGYQLDNIKATPDSLTKVSSYNPNNKIFPILEYYSCTDKEKEALRNKIKFNGMTVMRIGKIEDYILPEQTYIKGKLIRMEDIEADFHILNAIAEELNKGVYI